MYFKIALDFRIVFDTIFHQFFLDFRSQRTPKIKLKRWSVLILYTFSNFRLGSLVESILDDFGIDFGRLLASFFEHFREKGVSKKSSKNHVDFFTFCVDFRLQVGHQLGQYSGGLGLLSRFGEGSGLIFHTFLSISLSFLFDFWVSFRIVLRYMFALLLVPCSFNAEANNE